MIFEIHTETKTPEKPFTWIWVITATLLLHLLLLSFRWRNHQTPLPQRMEVQEISPKKLKNIREKWGKKSFIFTPASPHDPSRMNVSDEDVSDARYFSNQNFRVLKEQKARKTDILPHQSNHPKASLKESLDLKSPQKATPLSKFALPFHLNEKPQEETLPDSQETHSETAVLDKNLPEGSQTLLNTQRSIHYSFFARIHEAIAPPWKSQIQTAFLSLKKKIYPGEYITVIDAILDETGHILQIHRLHESGIEEFDEVAINVFKKAQQFRNPPPALLDGNGEIHLVYQFVFELNDKLNPFYFSPQRVF